jgi:hypothetical protein
MTLLDRPMSPNNIIGLSSVVRCHQTTPSEPTWWSDVTKQPHRTQSNKCFDTIYVNAILPIEHSNKWNVFNKLYVMSLYNDSLLITMLMEVVEYMEVVGSVCYPMLCSQL